MTVTTDPFRESRTFSKVCSKGGCNNPTHAKGLCSNCYQLNYRATSDGVITGMPKLTREDCRQVRLRKAGFATFQEIAREFQVSIGVIRKVLRREYVPLEDFMEAREGKD